MDVEDHLVAPLLFSWSLEEVLFEYQQLLVVLFFFVWINFRRRDYIFELKHFAWSVLFNLALVFDDNASVAIAFYWFHEMECPIDPPYYFLDVVNDLWMFIGMILRLDQELTQVGVLNQRFSLCEKYQRKDEARLIQFLVLKVLHVKHVAHLALSPAYHALYHGLEFVQSFPPVVLIRIVR